MILVSFFSEENVLSDEIKTCNIFELQSTENPLFHLFWDTWVLEEQKYALTCVVLRYKMIYQIVSPHAVKYSRNSFPFPFIHILSLANIETFKKIHLIHE